jgi:hypothetical protein
MKKIKKHPVVYGSYGIKRDKINNNTENLSTYILNKLVDYKYIRYHYYKFIQNKITFGFFIRKIY